MTTSESLAVCGSHSRPFSATLSSVSIRIRSRKLCEWGMGVAAMVGTIFQSSSPIKDLRKWRLRMNALTGKVKDYFKSPVIRLTIQVESIIRATPNGARGKDSRSLRESDAAEQVSVARIGAQTVRLRAHL